MAIPMQSRPDHSDIQYEHRWVLVRLLHFYIPCVLHLMPGHHPWETLATNCEHVSLEPTKLCAAKSSAAPGHTLVDEFKLRALYLYVEVAHPAPLHPLRVARVLHDLQDPLLPRHKPDIHAILCIALITSKLLKKKQVLRQHCSVQTPAQIRCCMASIGSVHTHAHVKCACARCGSLRSREGACTSVLWGCAAVQPRVASRNGGCIIIYSGGEPARALTGDVPRRRLPFTAARGGFNIYQYVEPSPMHGAGRPQSAGALPAGRGVGGASSRRAGREKGLPSHHIPGGDVVPKNTRRSASQSQRIQQRRHSNG